MSKEEDRRWELSLLTRRELWDLARSYGITEGDRKRDRKTRMIDLIIETERTE